MKKHWHYQASAALAPALLCLLASYLLREQGWHRLRLFGSEFGFARIKSMTFLYFQNESNRFDFPFDSIMYFGALGSVCIALFVTWKHFRTGRIEA